MEDMEQDEEPKVFETLEPRKENGDGDVSIHEFIADVDALAVSEGLDDEEAAKQSILKMTPQMREFFDILDGHEQVSWCLLKEKLISRYSDPPPPQAVLPRRPLTLRQKIQLRRGLKQRRGETARAFHDRCYLAQEKISDDKPSSASYERDVLLNFVLGLKGYLQDRVIQYDCNDLNGFLLAAEDAERDHQEQMDQIQSVKSESNSRFNDNDESSFGDFDFGDGDPEPEVNPMDNVQVKHEPEQDADGGAGQASNEGDQEEEEDDGQTEYKCEMCSRTFHAKLFLQQHMEKEHSSENVKINCEYCPAFFASKHSFKIHMKLSHKDFIFPCEYCNRVLYNKAKSMFHLALRHMPRSEDGTKAICRFCGKAMKNMETLRKHLQRSHIIDKTYPCNVCDKTFTISGDLQAHVRSAHLNEKRFKCDHCDRQFTGIYGLRYHERSVHNIGDKMKCDQCERSFNSDAALNEHIARVHKQEPTFMCEECGKGFYHRGNMKKHVLYVHTGGVVKNVKCEYPECKSMFENPGLMRRHVKVVHTKEAFHLTCDYCPQRFNSPIRQADHINGVHLNKKTHECPYPNCSFVTAYTGKIRVHVKKQHGGIMPPPPPQHL